VSTAPVTTAASAHRRPSPRATARPCSASRFRGESHANSVAPPTVSRRRSSSRHARLDTVQFAPFRYLPRRPVSRSRREQRLRRLVGSPSYLAGRLGGMTVRMSLLAAAAFLSARFCLSVLPAFLLLDWRGDLSATAGSSGSGGNAPRPVARLLAGAEPGLHRTCANCPRAADTP